MPKSAVWALFVGFTAGCEVAMRPLFATANVHPRDRFDYWHDVACAHIVDHNAKPERRHDFYAELLTSSLADISLLLFENSPMEVWHTARQASVSTDEIFLCRQVAGTLTLQQDGRNVILEPDDFTLIEPLRPYNAQFFPGSKLLIVKIPRRSLEARIGKTRVITAHCIKPSNFENKLASMCLGLLATHGTETSSPAEEIVANKVLDLIALSLGKLMESATPRMSCARSLVFMSLTAAIEARLSDPALDVDTVATTAGVSRRYACAVFADRGTTIMQFIQAKRIERCRRALEDPVQSHRTVSEIAYGWGFSDMTHFGRKFRGTYGVTAREYRKAARVR